MKHWTWLACLAVALAGSTSAANAQMSAASQAQLKKQVKAYNDCVLGGFDRRMRSAGTDVVLRRQSGECDRELAAVRATLVRLPGATKDAVDIQLWEMQRMAAVNLIAILVLLEAAGAEQGRR